MFPLLVLARLYIHVYCLVRYFIRKLFPLPLPSTFQYRAFIPLQIMIFSLHILDGSWLGAGAYPEIIFLGGGKWPWGREISPRPAFCSHFKYQKSKLWMLSNKKCRIQRTSGKRPEGKTTSRNNYVLHCSV